MSKRRAVKTTADAASAHASSIALVEDNAASLRVTMERTPTRTHDVRGEHAIS
jgi:hypothetical protein